MASGQVLCPVLVGRDAEMESLRRLVDRAREGHGAVVALVGEAGIGKSRLARETQDAAVGMMLLRGRSAPSVSPVPYLALAEALIPAFRMPGVESEPTIAAARPALARILIEGPVRRAAEPSAPIVRDAVVGTFDALAKIGDGALVVLEDVHWADADTIGVLDYLSDHIADIPMLCVLTLRDDPGPALDLVEALAARRSAHRFALGRLSRDETGAMARYALDAANVSSELVDLLVERAEGVPFVIEEMLTAYAASGGEDHAPPVLPHTYRELVRERLGAVDQRTREVLFAAAVVGRRFDWSLLRAITELSREEVLEGLRIAVHAKLVSSDAAPGMDMPFGFRHAMVREAILAELLAPERAELSARAADAIEEEYPGLPGAWCERVAELREAAGDRAAAARHLQEGGQRAFVRGALASAEMMLERARVLVANDRWHKIGVDRSLVEVLSATGKVERLREIAADAVAFVEGKNARIGFALLGLGHLQLRLARGLASAGDQAGAEEHFRLAKAVAHQTTDERLVARVRIFEAVRALGAGDLEMARMLAGEAARLAEGLEIREVAVEALGVEGTATYLAGDATTAIHILERARDAAGDDIVARIPALVELGRVQAAVRGETASLESVRALAAGAGAVSAEIRADILIAQASLERFALDEADAMCRQATALAERYGLTLLLNAQELEAERRALLPGDIDAEGACADLTQPATAHLVLALRLEDHAAARTAALRVPGEPVARAMGVLLAAVSGEPAALFPTAHALAGRLLDAALAAGDPQGFATADANLERFPWWRHVTRRLFAATIPDAAPLIRESLGFFEDAGHDRLASACKAVLRTLGAPVPRKGRGDSTVPTALRNRGVTSREMDVLRLLARGFGNVEIAGRLFLSRRTVETHVASLMRKLDATTRAELVAAVNPVPPSG